MEDIKDSSVIRIFSGLTDPRGKQGKQHRLVDVVVVAISAVICGAESWSDMAQFGQDKQKWFETFLELPNGIPSHDTFARVFANLDAEEFEGVFTAWSEQLRQNSGGKLVAIDGKSLRRSFDTATQKSPLYLVNAWASDNGLCMAQVKVADKSNEITAIPQILDLLFLKGATVTLDAMGCQKQIVQNIIDKGADYLVCLKGNQGLLHREVAEFFTYADKTRYKDISYDFFETLDKEHGRVEQRSYWHSDDVDWYQDKEQWKGLRTFGMVRSERTVKGITSSETRYFISSLPKNARVFGQAARSHWGIENSLHWEPDVVMNEDQCRIRTKNAGRNFATLRKIALNLLKRAPTERKISIKTKRKSCGWNHDFLLKVLIS